MDELESQPRRTTPEEKKRILDGFLRTPRQPKKPPKFKQPERRKYPLRSVRQAELFLARKLRFKYMPDSVLRVLVQDMRVPTSEIMRLCRNKAVVAVRKRRNIIRKHRRYVRLDFGSEFYRRIAEDCGIPLTESPRIFEVIFRVLTDYLLHERNLRIKHFGEMWLQQQRGRALPPAVLRHLLRRNIIPRPHRQVLFFVKFRPMKARVNLTRKNKLTFWLHGMNEESKRQLAAKIAALSEQDAPIKEPASMQEPQP